MKHLKTFETINTSFKVGDIITIKNMRGLDVAHKYFENVAGEITEVFDDTDYDIKYHYEVMPSELKKKYAHLRVGSDYIYFHDTIKGIRYATEEEKEEYLKIENVKKYNL